MREIGNRIIKAREELGATQEQLAKEAGVSVRSWKYYEAGKGVANEKAARVLARHGINAEWIATGEGPMRVGADTVKPPMAANAMQHSMAIQIGARLRSIRGEGSQPEFSALLEASEEELERWERGDALLPAWVVFRLAETKGVAPVWLLAGLGPPFDTSGPSADPGRALKRRSVIPTLLCATFAALQEQLQARGLQLGHEEATNLAMAAYATIDSRESVTSYASLRQLTPQDVRPVVEFVLGMYEKQLPGNASAPK